MSDGRSPGSQPKPHGNPIKVLVVAASLDIVGGQSVQAALLLSHWRSDPDVAVDFLPVNPRLPGPLRQLQRVKYLRTVVTWPWYWLTLLVRVPRCSIVHVFSASYLSFVLAPTPAIVVARLFRKKIVLNYHSGEAEDHLARWRRTAISTLRRSDSIVVPTDYLVQTFAKFGLEAHAIPNVVETDRFSFRERRPLQPRFLSNRNLEPMYNVGSVLRAFALIQKKIPHATLAIVGEGSQRLALELLATELKLNGVTFIGRVRPDEMPRVYDEADIFLNASEIDNMPLSILESFSAGLPVVTTDAGGIPFIVKDGENGFLVKMGDDAALAERALRLLADPELAAGVAARARASCSEYTWEAVRGKWLSLYEGMMEQSRSDPARPFGA